MHCLLGASLLPAPLPSYSKTGRLSMKAAPVKLLLVKQPVYQAISELNRAFEQVIFVLEGLSAFHFFRRDCLKANQVMVEEIRALANHELLEILGQREFGNMAYYERVRLKWQNRFKEPSKVLPGNKEQIEELQKGLEH